MKNKTIAGLIVAGFLMSGAAFTALAQNGNGQSGQGNGLGYGGPPQSQEERAARQAACLEKNDGICPNGGLRAICPGQGQGMGKGQCKSQCKAQCQGQGMGKGKGAGYGHRNGLRDGTGPRSVNGTCPNTNAPAQLKK
jgi:hypothetical protein